MINLTCHELEKTIIRDWLNGHFDEEKGSEIKSHICCCQICYRAFIKISARGIFDALPSHLDNRKDELEIKPISTVGQSTKEETKLRFRQSQKFGKTPISQDLEESFFKGQFFQFCYRLEDAFSKTGRNCLSKKTIIEIMEATIGASFLNIRGRQIDLLSVLAKEGIVSVDKTNPQAGEKIAEDELYQTRWEITPLYLLNRLWGVPLEGGLKVLFEGGILLRAASGVSSQILGEPGVGKSILGVHMAAIFASQGHTGVYVAGSGDASLFIDQLTVLGYSPRMHSDDGKEWLCFLNGKEFIVKIQEDLSSESELSPQSPSVAYEPGVLSFIKIESTLWVQTPQIILKTLKGISSKVKNESCFVFDCLNEIIENHKDLTSNFLNSLFKFEPMQIGFFISSVNAMSDLSLNIRQKSDIVIHLTKEKRGKDVSDRAIEISKSQTQRTNMGKHYYSIDRPDGLTIYPTPRSLLYIWKRRKGPFEMSTPVSWKSDSYFDLDPVLNNDIRRGSAILLRGKRSTHRFPIGLTFLASALKENKEAQVILLSLRDSRETIYQTIQHYPQLYSLLGPRRNEFSSRIVIGHLPPDRFGPERILEWTRQVLAQHRQKDKITRVLFSNLTQLRNSSLFEEDKVFVPALIELFKKQRVTSLFIDTINEQIPEGPDRFDVVLRTDYLSSERTRLSVEYTAICNAGHNPWLLSRERANQQGILEPTGGFHILTLSRLAQQEPRHPEVDTIHWTENF